MSEATTNLRPARMPVVFAGHGSPMNALGGNPWSDGFARLGEGIARPRAILAISAHWWVPGVYLTAQTQPPTIHDFGGFPQALFEIEYPAPGSPDLARRVRERLVEGKAAQAETSAEWGLDHGTWSVLRWMYPEADVPVVQLSLDRRLDPARHYALGRSLAPLRDEGVLIFTTGNVVHNLRDAFTQMRAGTANTPDWARDFDAEVVDRLGSRDTLGLLDTWPNSERARLAHPTPDHWLPLLYAYAASEDDDPLSFPTTGFDLGSVSMRNVVFG